MTLIKLLALAFGPPIINWVVARLWFTYRELRLDKFVFAAWLILFMPAAVLVVNGIAQAVDVIAQMGDEETAVWAASLGRVQSGSRWMGTAVSSGFGVEYSGFDWLVNKGAAYPLRVSHYDPALGGTNCDHDCSTMASGDKVADWIGGRNGVYAAACPREWGWQTGTQFSIAGVVYECRDTGGWINCYEPGEYDPALKQSATLNYCWVDLMRDPIAPYGALVADWSLGTAVPKTSGLLTQETAVHLLYMGAEPVQSQGLHGEPGYEGWDWTAGCDTPLYSPVPGVATVIKNGTDGWVGPYAQGGEENTMLVISGAGGTVTLFHGLYTAAVGSTVVGGVTRIGYEDDIGNVVSGPDGACHQHISIK